MYLNIIHMDGHAVGIGFLCCASPEPSPTWVDEEVRARGDTSYVGAAKGPRKREYCMQKVWLKCSQQPRQRSESSVLKSLVGRLKLCFKPCGFGFIKDD